MRSDCIKKREFGITINCIATVFQAIERIAHSSFLAALLLLNFCFPARHTFVWAANTALATAIVAAVAEVRAVPAA